MLKILIIASGGAIGAIARYFISHYSQRFFDPSFPAGTLSVNLIGSLIIGFVWGIFEFHTASIQLRAFLFIGFLGSFTTFSTYTMESFNLIREGEMKLALFNIVLHNIAGLILVVGGYFLARSIFK